MISAIRKIKGELSLPIIVVCTYLFCSYPYVFNRFITLPSLIVLSGACLLFGVLYFIGKRNPLGFDRTASSIWIIQIVGWFFLSVFHADSTYVTRIVFLVVAILLLRCSYLKTHSYLPLIKVLNYIIFIQAILAAIGFFLVFLGILQPFFYFENVDMRQGVFYLFTCTNAQIVNFIRVAGYFDEPGAFAFWGVFTLVFNKLFVGNKRMEVTIMVCMLFTFSLAYILELVLYLLFFGKGNSVRIAIGIIVIFIAINFLSNFDSTSKEIVDRLVYERVDSNLHDENERNPMAERALKHFKVAPLLGRGAEKLEKIEYVGDNPFEILAKDGIFGYILIYLPLFVVFIKGKRTEKIAVLLLFIEYQQRPFHINPMHFIYLNLFLLAVLWNHKTEKIVQQKKLVSPNQEALK